MPLRLFTRKKQDNGAAAVALAGGPGGQALTVANNDYYSPTGPAAQEDARNRLSCGLDDILTSIDEGREAATNDRPDGMPRSISVGPSGQPASPSSSSSSSNDWLRGHFAKVNCYANSRLPASLPPLHLYTPTYPLLCLAAQHALAVYQSSSSSATAATASPSSSKSTWHLPASRRHGTKAMTISTSTQDASDTVVVSIRGSASFADWATNFQDAPTAPAGFLDDAGNACHAGFLAAAQGMLEPIARRLTTLLAERAERGRERRDEQRRRRRHQPHPNHPSRGPPGRGGGGGGGGGGGSGLKGASLVFTGHSAGGAVASLLYAHAMSASAEVRSPLKDVAARFRRVHCVVFGAPPVSLLPLAVAPSAARGSSPSPNPSSSPSSRSNKSLFFAFVNEGDPVARADVAYARSLVSLMVAPAPARGPGGRLPTWPTPPGVLSCAGRLVLLRSGDAAAGGGGGSGRNVNPRATGGRGASGVAAAASAAAAAAASAAAAEKRVAAYTVRDSDLRGVVFGDPLMHSMKLYARRIEALAVEAVTGGVHIV